jgi:hypothetical protein
MPSRTPAPRRGWIALRVLAPFTIGAIGAAVAFACSSSNGSPGSADAGDADASCGPLPETLSVSAFDNCVALVPNACCGGFYGYDCLADDGSNTLDGGGAQCSETAACVRASRYDQSLCAGAEAYSCPDLAGVNFATLPTPECEQMEGAGPAGEGIRWCCGPNLPPSTYDAAAPPPNDDAAPPTNDDAAPPVVDAGHPAVDAGHPVVDAGHPVVDAAPPPSDDAGADDAAAG